MRPGVVEQTVKNLPVVRLSCGQAEPDRQPLRVDDDSDFRYEGTSGATETMIWTSLSCRCSLLVRPDRSASDHLNGAVLRSADGFHHPIPHIHLPPSHEAVVAGGARAVALLQVPLWHT